MSSSATAEMSFPESAPAFISEAGTARILVVDDQPSNIQIVGAVLGGLGHEIIPAADGPTALRRVALRSPDLILLDIGLPELNGLEVANRIRQVASGARILFLTSNMDKDIVRAAFSTGARGYVLKADAGRELLPAVAGVLGGDDFVSSGIRSNESDEIDNDKLSPYLNRT